MKSLEFRHIIFNYFAIYKKCYVTTTTIQEIIKHVYNALYTDNKLSEYNERLYIDVYNIERACLCESRNLDTDDDMYMIYLRKVADIDSLVHQYAVDDYIKSLISVFA